MNLFAKTIAVMGALLAPAAYAQDFPDRPVTLIVPYSAGAANDILGRVLADALSKEWGQPVVVQNVPGAGAAIGIGQVARSEPDGYTLLWASSTFSPTAASNPDLPFDFAADLVPIQKVGEGELVAITGKRVPLLTVEDLVREAKAQTIFVAGTGPASIPTFVGKLLGDQIGAPLEVVNYAGGSEAIIDVIAGRADVYVGTVTSTQGMIKDGAAHAMVMFSAERSKTFPDVPTMAELGYPDATVGIWWGIFGPTALAPEIVEQVNADIAKVMASSEMVELFDKQGAAPMTMSQPEFVTVVNDELARWKGLAEKYNIVAE